jgi:hypothetical protein
MIAAGITPHTIAARVMEIVSFLYGSDIDGSAKLNGRFAGLTAEKLPAIATNTLMCKRWLEIHVIGIKSNSHMRTTQSTTYEMVKRWESIQKLLLTVEFRISCGLFVCPNEN